MNIFFNFIEFLWTALPFILILMIVVPFFIVTNLSVATLGVVNASLPYYILANQWFWEFSCLDADYSFSELISYVTVYNYLTLSSVDVIHAFHLPYFMIKSDCVPGMVSNLSFYSAAPGIYHGYCAQICGQNHSLMCFTCYIL
jgi:cytochrome c oxidase subunit 2